MRKSFAFFCAVWAAGCASQYETLSFENLKPPVKPASITFAKDFFYPTPEVAGSANPKYPPYKGLLAGVYRAAWEDKEGTFYLGAGTCLVGWVMPTDGKRVVTQGGVWIENKPEHPKFRLFEIRMSSAAVVEDPSNPATPVAHCAQPGEPAPAQSETASFDDPNGAGLGVGLQTMPKGAPPAAAGLGVGLGAGIVTAIADMDRGKVRLLPPPPANIELQGTFVRGQ